MTGATGRIRIARVFGAPIFLHFSWVVIFALIVWTLATGYFPSLYPDLPVVSYWAKGLFASFFFFVSILLHEMGHALVAVRHGIGVRSITLFVFGGVAQLEKDPEDGATEFKIALGGPVVSVLLGGGFYLLAGVSLLGPGIQAVVAYLSMINFILAGFNLVPAFPLDGGRLLRGLLWSRLGRTRATRVAAGAGTAFAYFLILIGAASLVFGLGVAGVWYVLLGWFLKDASQGAYQSARFDETLQGVTVRDAMLEAVEALPGHVSLTEAARDYFLKTGYGGYPVVRNGQVVGLLSLRDVMSVAPSSRDSTSVQSIMTPLLPAITVPPALPLLDALRRMTTSGSGRLLVMEDDRFEGLLTLNSILRHIRVREELNG